MCPPKLADRGGIAASIHFSSIMNAENSFTIIAHMDYDSLNPNLFKLAYYFEQFLFGSVYVIIWKVSVPFFFSH